MRNISRKDVNYDQNNYIRTKQIIRMSEEHLNILLAEDSTTIRDFVEHCLFYCHDNFTFNWASNGVDAIRSIKHNKPDLILLDLIMPFKSGLEVLKKLKNFNDTKDIPVIVLTSTDNIEEVFDYGATDYIRKPFKKVEFTARVKSVIRLIATNRKVEQQTAKIKEQYNTLRRQSEVIVVKNKEIIDELTYAKRIQQATLPQEKEINNLLPKNFITYKPRNIVSGDFYWVSKHKDKIIVAAADCTGHGASGAFMHMIGVVNLTQIINSENFNSAKDILENLRFNIMKSLQQTGDENEAKDGMDIALVIIDFNNYKLEYCGAMNPLYIVRNNKLLITRADRIPVGIHINFNSPFTNHQIDLEPNDRIFLFSDGYADQFGGENNKKLGSRKLKQLLIDTSTETITKQKELLEETFFEWKGKQEQVDDILIIGIEVE